MSRSDEPRRDPTAASRLRRPFQEFAALEASGGLVLLAAAALALAWANSPWSASYARLWQVELRLAAAGFELAKPLLLWINEGLMAVFFLLVGLEIKREVLVGELASPRQAALPIAAALGGMAVPAALYAALNAGGEGAAGWGIPMATDIAFALGVLALLGPRVPVALKILLTALAIADDLGAVTVIALFYTEDLAWRSLAGAAAVLAVLWLANRAGVRRPLIYAALGLVLWLLVLKSGIHATVAGVLLATAIPARSRLDSGRFLAEGRTLLAEFEAASRGAAGAAADERRRTAVLALEEACEAVETPLQRLEHGLHGWVSFGIMPLFALANAGVALGAGLEALRGPVALGILAGLVLGKPLGIVGFSWLAVRAGWSHLPAGLSWRALWGVGCVAGIGFTMSLFIGGLAFGTGELLEASKLGILGASLVSGLLGWALLRPSAGR